jgi:hypothetical protein
MPIHARAGCAFVVFDRWSSCEAAIAGLHGKTHLEGAKMPLVVKFADAKVRASERALQPCSSSEPRSANLPCRSRGKSSFYELKG